MRSAILPIVIGICVLAFQCTVTQAQDTVQVSLNEFISKGIENSAKLKAERTEANLAQNKIVKARSLKYLPDAKMETRHSLVPGVKSDSILPSGKPLPDDHLFLDPNLENDFDNLNLFTSGEISAVQPIFGWGAINKAISAAQSGAQAAEFKYSAEEADLKIQLFKLYHSYILARELQILISDAQKEIDDIDKKLSKMEEEGDPDLDISDFYKFKIFKVQFKNQVAEVEQNIQFVQNTWNWILQAGDNTVFIPSEKFLDTVQNEIKSLTYYRNLALSNRYELEALDETIRAADFGLQAAKAQNLPMLFAGFKIEGAFTPNRPRQDNPFIRNNSTFFGGRFGLGIRQNLNFFSVKSNIQKSSIQYRKAKYLKNTAIEGIILDLNNRYKEANIAFQELQNSREALTISKRWERQEQLDYDLGFGEPKDLLESIRTKMELQAELKRKTYQYNLKMAQLHHSAGLSIESLKTN